MVRENGFVWLAHAFIPGRLLFSFSSETALANEAMDQLQSWMTLSDDNHQQRHPLPLVSLEEDDEDEEA